MLESTSPARISADVASNLFVLNGINVIWVPMFQWIPEQSKGKSYMDSVFSPKIPALIEMGRNSHDRKKLFCSSCSIMTAWAPECFVSCGATPFPVLFSPAWQLIYWLPIQFCLPSDFLFTACFITLLSFLHSFLGHGGVDSWQVIVINHLHESNLLCLSEENIQRDPSFPGKFYCLSFVVFSISFDRTGYLTIWLCLFLWQSDKET